MKEIRFRVALVTLTMFSVVFAAGCRHNFSINAPAVVPQISDNDYLKNPSGTPPSLTKDLSDYAAAAPVPAQAANAKQLRNEIVYNLMGAIDQVYGEYTIRLNSGKATEAISFDSLTLGLSSAASIATHVATKTILSALGTGIGGLGESVDKNVFSQQTFAVLGIAMQTRRDKIRNAIITDLSHDDVTEYPLSAAKRDLIEYYYAGTLSGGLQELQEEAGTATGKGQAATVAVPAFSPVGGSYNGTSVTITDATPDAIIYYTIDGVTTPTSSSNTYSGPIQVTAATTIKAIAIAAGASSAVGSATYTIDAASPPPPPPAAGAPPVPAVRMRTAH
jgi:hypothetical protein